VYLLAGGHGCRGSRAVRRGGGRVVAERGERDLQRFGQRSSDDAGLELLQRDVQSGEIDFYHSLKGHSGNEWSLFFTSPHSGTWKPTGLAGSSSFSLEDNGSISISWDTKSGSFTVKDNTGSVHVTLEPEPGSSGHGLVHVQGTWNCP
jgi:hypothetical protein